MKLLLSFSTGLETGLGPFMSTVSTLVCVLELFDVNDYRFSLLNGYGVKRGRRKTA
jgi:hypothetical protein